MTNLEFCLACRKKEMAAFVRVLKAMTDLKLDYRPDPKSRTAAELATMIADEDGALVKILDSGKVEWSDPKPLKSAAEIVALYERNASAVNERLAKVKEAAWEGKGQFLMGGQVVWEDTVSNMAWGFLFDSIHHRGQLSTYLRPMGGKVPSIYGPSADDSGS
jgi:uncharacterized damage-inducible protein DinB